MAINVKPALETQISKNVKRFVSLHKIYIKQRIKENERILINQNIRESANDSIKLLLKADEYTKS